MFVVAAQLHVPVVAVTLVAGAVLIPDSRDPAPGRLDLPGMVLSALGVAALAFPSRELGLDRVEGPVVAQMQAAFMDNWTKVTGQVYSTTDYFPPLAPAEHDRDLLPEAPAPGWC